MIKIPDDAAELHELFEKKTDELEKLEVRLTIRECPSMERALEEIFLAIFEAQRARKRCKALQKPLSSDADTVEKLKQQKIFYEQRLEEVNQKLKSITSEQKELKVYFRAQDKLNSAEDQVADLYKFWREAFNDRGKDLLKLIPALQEIIG